MEIIYSILGSGAVVSLITFFFTRQKGKQEVRKLAAEANSNELDNYRKMREIIQAELEPYIAMIEELKKKIGEMEPKLCQKSGCQNREN